MPITLDLPSDQQSLLAILNVPRVEKLTSLLLARDAVRALVDHVELMNSNDLGRIGRILAYMHSDAESNEARKHEALSRVPNRSAGAIYCLNYLCDLVGDCFSRVAACNFDNPRTYLNPLSAARVSLHNALDCTDTDDMPWLTPKQIVQTVKAAITEIAETRTDFRKLEALLDVEQTLLGEGFYCKQEQHHSESPTSQTDLASGETLLPSPPSCDGIVEPYGFCWQGKEYQFPKNQRRCFYLVKAIWPTITKRAIPIEEVNERLVRMGYRRLHPKTIGEYAREATQLLANKCGFPCSIKKDGDVLRCDD